MNKKADELKTTQNKKNQKKEIRFQESPVERALKLSSDQLLAMAIRDALARSELN